MFEKSDLSSAFDTHMVESANALYDGWRFVEKLKFETIFSKFKGLSQEPLHQY